MYVSPQSSVTQLHAVLEHLHMALVYVHVQVDAWEASVWLHRHAIVKQSYMPLVYVYIQMVALVPLFGYIGRLP